MDDTHKKLKRWWQLCNSNTIDHMPSDFEWWDEIDNFIKDPFSGCIDNETPQFLAISQCSLRCLDVP